MHFLAVFYGFTIPNVFDVVDENGFQIHKLVKKQMESCEALRAEDDHKNLYCYVNYGKDRYFIEYLSRTILDTKAIIILNCFYKLVEMKKIYNSFYYDLIDSEQFIECGLIFKTRGKFTKGNRSSEQYLKLLNTKNDKVRKEMKEIIKMEKQRRENVISVFESPPVKKSAWTLTWDRVFGTQEQVQECL